MQLKYDAGTLSPADLIKLNRLLSGSVKMDYKQQDYKADPYYNAAEISELKSKKTSASKRRSKVRAKRPVKQMAPKAKAPKALALPAAKASMSQEHLPAPSRVQRARDMALPKPA